MTLAKPELGRTPGRRPTLVLAPGMACDAAVWEPQVARLSDVANIVILDYGATRSVTAMAVRALAAADDRLFVAGHSMGGRVALEMIRLAPDRVRGLCLLGTEHRPRPDGAAGEAETAGRRALLAVARAEGMQEMGRRWLPALLGSGARSDETLAKTLLAMFGRGSAAAMEAQISAGYDRPDHAGLLPRITCPVLLIAGEEDALRPASVHREMMGLIGSARLLLLQGCGHMMTLERPADVSAAMRGWLLDAAGQNSKVSKGGHQGPHNWERNNDQLNANHDRLAG
ncbi:alpha/beta fold hydrolase [uncultured Sphingomonas sp.]|uniref:alpha/beta fold hydrolase n=1 Tax=uncultured Sphingomonas sp. TaxID=158754 RepID=UPI0035CC3605